LLLVLLKSLFQVCQGLGAILGSFIYLFSIYFLSFYYQATAAPLFEGLFMFAKAWEQSQDVFILILFSLTLPLGCSVLP